MNRGRASRGSDAWRAAIPWVGGLGVGAAVLGPGLGRGHLLNLDLVTTPRLRLPDWRWGVGPGLPHRVPLYVPASWLSRFLDGALVIKMLYLLAIGALFVGVWRLAASGDRRIDAGVALVVSMSPFTITRVAVGHIGVVLAMACVAWGAPGLLRLDRASSRSNRRLAAIAGIAGLVPGTWVLATATAGAMFGPRSERRSRMREWVFLLPMQLWWLLPSTLFAITGPRLVGGNAFRPSIDALAPLELFAGLGFWRFPSQVPGPPWWPLVSIVLLVLTVLGWRSANQRFGRPWVLLSSAVIVMPIAAAVPLVSVVVRRASETPFGAPLRESQRWWGMALVLLAPALAAGVVELGHRTYRLRGIAPAVPAIAAFLLAGNGLWGDRGALEPVHYPRGWSAAAAIVRAAPGATLALPWHQYIDVPFAHNRRVLAPLPEYLPGDVVASTDPELGTAAEEADARAKPALLALADPGSTASTLAALGIRYVAIATAEDSDVSRRQLERAPGVTTLYEDGDITLFRIDATVTRSVQRWIGPLGRLAAGEAPVPIPGGTGWMLGGQPVGDSAALLDSAGRGGVLWYWPALFVIVGDSVAVVSSLTAIGWTGRRRRAL